MLTFNLTIIVIILSLILANLYKNHKATKQDLEKLNSKYGGIIDIDKEVDFRSLKLNELQDSIQKENEKLKNLVHQSDTIIDIDKEINSRSLKLNEIQDLIQKENEKYSFLFGKSKELNNTIKLLEENAEILEYGLYKPHFEFDTSEKYKKVILDNNEWQKDLIKKDMALICSTNWEVGGSKAEGKKMIKKISKLMLRAFNGECDACIAKTRWNNLYKMEERIEKAYEAINKQGEVNNIYISEDYLKLKLNQLHLTYEYEEKKYEEKEEQKRIQAQIREEQRAQKEFDEELKEAEEEERNYQRALTEAHKQLGRANEEERQKYEEKIAILQKQLQEAEERKRAISQAQLTKCGHIYVISNVGSFGENIYKIGMTRRLEPMDRVNELGDASVPFKFDVHAMIFSENAPALESKLHEIFKDKSVNLINFRKEFFKVNLEEIEKAVKENYGYFEFTKIAEAKEYRQTIAITKGLENVL